MFLGRFCFYLCSSAFATVWKKLHPIVTPKPATFMSDISITPELNSKKLKDGTQRIQIPITLNKKHCRIATEYSVHEKFWNTERHEVLKGASHRDSY
ncbi:hypothetical protein C5O19_11140 [Siphonobacter curvatus]|uniref:Arm DNA-binding domain-containing protein n=2 Tax=Siphonobacter curvatus TaxID=2094562 RepID=A0A2S7IQZ8_9BACT|nr:hypothetical protein C5O19_11140 [Siphonobacter curvatus]